MTATVSARSASRIAILKPCCIGDVIMTTPLLFALRRAYPNAVIDWLVGSWSADAVRGHPLIHRLIDLGPTANPARTPAGLLRLVKVLRGGHYDQLYVPDRSPWLSLAALLSAIPLRVGLDSAGRGFGYNHRAPITPTVIRREADIYLDLARRMGLSVTDCWLNCVPTASARAELAAILNEHAPAAADLAQPLILVHPGGGSNPGMTFSSKRWPVEDMTTLSQQVASAVNGSVIILGSTADAESAGEISALLSPETLQYNLCGRFTLPQLAALSAQPNVRLYIGNDTGTAHLAAAVGAPTLMIFGPSDPHRYAPFVPVDRAAVAWRPVPLPAQGVSGRQRIDFDWARDGVTAAEAWIQAQQLLHG